MGLIGKQLGKVAYITATAVGSAQTLITNPTTLDTIVTSITFHNTDTSAIVCTICRVANSGGSADTADINDEIWQQSVDPSDTALYDVPFAMRDTNDTVQVYADTGSKINCWGDGFTLPTQT